MTPIKRNGLRHGSISRPGLLSTQVLQEFYVAVTRKLSVPLEPETAEPIVLNLSLLPVIVVDSQRILAAIGRSGSR
ncbi:MAG TPA: hypothetical protein VEF34_17530 [Syntrophobacteraceae bacterium]|nr:hypothetical protein [Syntrophobacteraceae bacterium]